MTEWVDVPYPGSFQRGLVIRTGEPRNAVWRQIERLGTIDSLTRIAKRKNQDASVAKVASLRLRQAVELRQAARGASVLTTPLLLYYSALNLVRGVLLTFFGEIGGPSHGLKYRAGSSLLECSAELTKKGTFAKFAAMHGVRPEVLETSTFTLRNLFAVIPEVSGDFPLLNAGHASVAGVQVTAMIKGVTQLRFVMPGRTAEEFAAQWTELLPWLKDQCGVTEVPFTLRIREQLADDGAVAAFCQRYLLHDLMRREEPIWYDHIAGGNVALLPRLPAYLAILFILSNVSRYEPEFLDATVREATDLGYFLQSMLDASERFFPQLILELLVRKPVFFT